MKIYGTYLKHPYTGYVSKHDGKPILGEEGESKKLGRKRARYEEKKIISEQLEEMYEIIKIDVTKILELDYNKFIVDNNSDLNDSVVAWENVLYYSKSNLLVSDFLKINEIKFWFTKFNILDTEEIMAWEPYEVNAALLQYIVDDIKIMKTYKTYEKYIKAIEDGMCSGRLYRSGKSWILLINFYAGKVLMVACLASNQKEWFRLPLSA